MNTIAFKTFKENLEKKLIENNQSFEGLVLELSKKNAYALVLYQKENQTYQRELISIFYEEQFAGMNWMERLKTLSLIVFISSGTKEFKIRKNMVPLFFQ